MPWVGLQCVIVVFPDNTHLLFWCIPSYGWKRDIVLKYFKMAAITDITERNGPRREKTCLRRFANNKDADQPAHPRRLISAFVIRLLESIIAKLATSKLLTF